MWDWSWVRELGFEAIGYSVQNTLDSGYVVLGTYMPFWWPEIIVHKIKSDYACIEEADKSEQKDFSLLRLSLNPFGKNVEIQYEVYKETDVCLEVYNMLGQEIMTLVDENQSKGFYTETWDGKDKYGKNLPSGVYFLKLETLDFIKTEKMFLLR